jgi:cysteine desulfurase/selenocysteine lyase
MLRKKSLCGHYIGMKPDTTALIPTAAIPLEEFPALKNGLYANHAAISPWPRVTAQAVAAFAMENTEIGSEKYSHWLLRETRLRKMLASLINADSADDIAFLKNTTEGMCT